MPGCLSAALLSLCVSLESGLLLMWHSPGADARDPTVETPSGSIVGDVASCDAEWSRDLHACPIASAVQFLRSLCDHAALIARAGQLVFAGLAAAVAAGDRGRAIG